MEEPLLIYLDEVTSTNSYLRDISNIKQLEDGFTIYTDFQTAGRGQQGNIWESEVGKNLLFSTVLYPIGLKAESSFLISQIISLSIKDILDKYINDISIKWPNDIYWKEKKITGILIENDIMGDEIYRSIIGVGLNLNQDHFISNAPNPISLKQITGNTYHIKEILNDIINRMLFYFNERDSYEVIRTRYKKSLFRKDGFHPYADDRGIFLAQIDDVKDSGLFVLKLDSGEIREFAFKEVRYI